MKSEGAYNSNIIFFYCCIEIYQPFVFLAFVSICQIFTLAYTVNMAVIVIVSSFLCFSSSSEYGPCLIVSGLLCEFYSFLCLKGDELHSLKKFVLLLLSDKKECYS